MRNKNNILVFSMLAVLLITVGLFAMQIKNKPLKQHKLAEPALMSKPQSRQAELNTASAPKSIKILAEEIDKIEQYAKEFNMPAELKEELMQAIKKGAVDTEWGKTEITKKELDEAGLSLKKLAKQKPDSKTENIVAGYIVNGTKFEKMLAACNPAKDDNPQEKELKRQALEKLGYSALAEGNKEKLGEVVNRLDNSSSDIPKEPIFDEEIQCVPMIDLEYALLLFEEGRKEEAIKVIDEAISQNQGDKEFVEIAKALRDNINKYE